MPVPFGLIDLPGRQRQQPAMISLDTFGHLMAAGAPRSGRSQLLRTIAAAVAVGFSCADAHLYGIDCGNGALLPLDGLPHCGAVVTRTQDERAARLLARLAAELTRRQDLLAAGGIPIQAVTANLTRNRPVRCETQRQRDPGIMQDLPHRGGCDRVAELDELA